MRTVQRDLRQLCRRGARHAREQGESPYVSPLLRDPPVGRRSGVAGDSGASGPPFARHDPEIYPGGRRDGSRRSPRASTRREAMESDFESRREVIDEPTSRAERSFAPPRSFCVSHDGQTVMAGDGQVTFGKTVMKGNARKVRRSDNGKVIAGFAGGTADAFTLFERFERSSKAHGRICRALRSSSPRTGAPTASCAGSRRCCSSPTREQLFVLSGVGDVIEPDEGVCRDRLGRPLTRWRPRSRSCATRARRARRSRAKR